MSQRQQLSYGANSNHITSPHGGLGLSIRSHGIGGANRQVVNTNANQSNNQYQNNNNVGKQRIMKKVAYYQRKNTGEKRKIIQKPWSKPMAAQHLAAVKIQSAIRRFLYIKRRLERQAYGRNYNMQSNRMKGASHQQQLQMRGKQQVQGGKMYQQKQSNTSEMNHLTPNQRLRQKFFTSPFNVLHKSEETCWRNFCAALIQATYKMALTRRLFKYHRFAMYHIAAIQIQWAWRGYQERKKKVVVRSKESIAVEKIQKAWRSFTNVKIFKYYKDLINFKEKGDPAQLLKSVNPSEAGILDAASKCHIRFRLGGDKFPPLIYYKIFAHGSIIDINAFAPRDYVKIKKDKKKQVINIKYDKDPNDKHDGWYNRYENNGWRPISDKILTPYDAVELRTANKPKKFHFDKKKRKEMTAQDKRAKKLKWLRKLYKDAKNAEILQDAPEILQQTGGGAKKADANALEQLYDNPFDDKRFMQLDDGDFDNEVNNLIEWCEDLDYEKYTNNWHQLATSAYAGQDSGANQANLMASNMGGSYMMRGQTGDGQGMMLGGDPLDMDQIRNTLNGDDRYAAAFNQHQMQEEQFLKSNVDYENSNEESLDKLEKILQLKQINFGTSSPEYTKTCLQISNICNVLAIELLKTQQFQRAHELLKKSELLCENNDYGRAMTYNNFACYYRKQGKLRSALQYLEKALEIEQTLPYHSSKADTHLNICAVLSQMHKHDIAMHHAQSAIIIAQSNLLRAFLPNRENHVDVEAQAQLNREIQQNFKDRIAVLAIAYHNLGVEQEFLKLYHQSLESYRQAKEFAERYLGSSDGITQNLNSQYLKARNEIDKKMEYNAGKIKRREMINQERQRVFTAHSSQTRLSSGNISFNQTQSRPVSKKAGRLYGAIEIAQQEGTQHVSSMTNFLKHQGNIRVQSGHHYRRRQRSPEYNQQVENSFFMQQNNGAGKGQIQNHFPLPNGQDIGYFQGNEQEGDPQINLYRQQNERAYQSNYNITPANQSNGFHASGQTTFNQSGFDDKNRKGNNVKEVPFLNY
eukprot:403352176